MVGMVGKKTDLKKIIYFKKKKKKIIFLFFVFFHMNIKIANSQVINHQL